MTGNGFTTFARVGRGETGRVESRIEAAAGFGQEATGG